MNPPSPTSLWTHPEATATNNSINANTHADPSHTLTRGSAFILLTSLVIPLVFHPFCGSLIYGPTSRFWLAAPTSAIGELLVIYTRLAEHIADSYGYRWFYDTTSTASSAFSFRHAVYSIVGARVMNSPDGMRRRMLEAAQSTHEAAEIIDNAVKSIHEGLRFRLGVALPIIAQYSKLMAVSGSGTVFLKVLGSIFAVHWCTLEALTFVAQRGDPEDVLTRVRGLLLISNRLPARLALYPEEDNFDIFDAELTGVHIICFILGFCLVTVFTMPANPQLLIIPYFWLVCLALVFPVRCHRGTMEVSPTTTGSIITRYKVRLTHAYMISPECEGPHIGGDIGAIFFVSWVFYCIFYFDGSDTQRPDWPWLDWLG